MRQEPSTVHRQFVLSTEEGAGPIPHGRRMDRVWQAWDCHGCEGLSASLKSISTLPKGFVGFSPASFSCCGDHGLINCDYSEQRCPRVGGELTG